MRLSLIRLIAQSLPPLNHCPHKVGGTRDMCIPLMAQREAKAWHLDEDVALSYIHGSSFFSLANELQNVDWICPRISGHRLTLELMIPSCA